MKNSRVRFVVAKEDYGAYLSLFNECQTHYNGGAKLADMKDAETWLKKGNVLFCVGVKEEKEYHRLLALSAKYRKQVYFYVTEHPSLMDKWLRELPKDVLIATVDRSYQQYLDKYYERKAKFIPVPGIEPKERFVWQERKNEVFFPGSYLSADSVAEKISLFVPEVLQPLVWKIIHTIEKNPSELLESVTWKCVQDSGFHANSDLVKELLTNYGKYIEEYVSRSLRTKVIRYLLRNGISVIVCGSNWNVFAQNIGVSEQNFLKIYTAEGNLQTVTNFMSEVKVVLNIAPNYKDAIHERVSCALQSGAYCFTEKNPFTIELATKYEGLKLYEYNHLSALVKNINKVLKDNRQPLTCVDNDVVCISRFLREIEEVFSDAEGVFHVDEEKELSWKYSAIKKCKKEFHSFLITDVQNFQELYHAVGNCDPSHIYILGEDLELWRDEFKLSDSRNPWRKKITVFRDVAELRSFFRKNKQVYLPEVVYSKNKVKLDRVIKQLRQERIENTESRKRNVFLSVCIPTYNRGNEAMRAIRRLQQLPYAEEIEILVSDNGSSKTCEVYEEIKNLKDSRIRYIRQKENIFFKGNMRAVLKLARGKFMLVQSDEDLMRVENIHTLLNELVNNPKVTFGVCQGIGTNFPVYDKAGLLQDYLKKVDGALNQTYLTGLFYAKKGVKEAEELYDELIDNTYVRKYVHCFFGLVAVKHGDFLVSKSVLFQEGLSSKTSNVSREVLFETSKTENRQKECEAIIECVDRVKWLDNVQLMDLIHRRVSVVYHFVNVSWYYFQDIYEQKGFDINMLADSVLNWSIGLMNAYKHRLGRDEMNYLTMQLNGMYEVFLNKGV